MSTPPSVRSGSTDIAGSTFADDVARSLRLTPRQIPARYLYDRLGSSLFEAICRLPWYRITDAEFALLRAHGPDVLARLGEVETVVELGPGSGEKLVTLVDAHVSRDLTVHLIDVSAEALATATRTIAARADLAVVTHEETYEEGLRTIAHTETIAGATLVLFLGSNIGNFDPPAADALLSDIRAALKPGDALLLGADLVKEERDLLLAYDDPLGVTAAFNRNLLVRINRELGADFVVERFAHRALWNAAESRMEMHLVSGAPQRVRVPAADLIIDLADGETIWTESSYKFRVEDLAPLLARAGFRVTGQWSDQGFALTLAQAVAA
jgi:L-histidine N-alpha-methyltransferase